MKKAATALLLITAFTAAAPTTLAWAQTTAPVTTGQPAPPTTGQPATPPPTSAQSEGSEHFRRGVEFSRDGDSRAALIEFRRAHELAPNYRVLFNIGQTALELQEYAQALEAFERYLADGGTQIPAERRVSIEAEVKRLQTRVANITINVNVPDAAVAIDDVAITSGVGHPIRVGAGRHKFSASAPDRLPTFKVLDLAGGETKIINLELRLPNSPAPLEPDTAPRTPPPPPRTALWVGVGITSALAIGTGVMGLLTLSSQNKFDDEVGRFVPTGNRSEIESARDSAKTNALVFDILAGATIVAGVTTLVIGLTGSRRRAQTTGLLLPDLARGTF